MSGYEWLTKPTELDLMSDVVKQLYDIFLKDTIEKARYDQAILDLYGYGTIRAPLYLRSLHSIRRDLVEGQEVRREGVRSGSKRRRKKGSRHRDQA